MQGSRRMSFQEFERALEVLAADQGVEAQQVRQKVASSSGPLCNAIQAAPMRLHDDKSTYTGTPACSLPNKSTYAATFGSSLSAFNCNNVKARKMLALPGSKSGRL